MRNTLFIGGGNMARAIIGGLLAKQVPANTINVVDLSPQAQQALTEMGVNNTSQWSNHLNPDQVVLAVKPQVFQKVIQDNKTQLKNKCIISLAAGISTQQIESWLGTTTARIIRSMPNTPALVGQGVTGLFFNQHCTPEDQQAARTLFTACGKVQIVDQEASINAITAISGSGPGYVFYFMEHLEKAALEFGFSPEQARELVSQTFYGAATLASNSDQSFTDLRQQVTSPGGTTFAGLEALRMGDVGLNIEKAAMAAKQRAEEMANNR